MKTSPRETCRMHVIDNRVRKVSTGGVSSCASPDLGPLQHRSQRNKGCSSIHVSRKSGRDDAGEY